jgi:hypothetical protein
MRQADGSRTTVAYAITFGVGHVLFHVWVPLHAERQVENVGRLGAVLQRIYPGQPSVTVGRPAISDDDLAWVVASQREPIEREAASRRGIIPR